MRPDAYGNSISRTPIPTAAALPAPLLAACRLDGVLAVLRETLPLAKLGLFWVLPALLGLVIGLILHFVRGKANA